MTATSAHEAVGLPLERRRPGSPMRETAAGPLWILGAARSSQTLLACALAQHPALRLVLDTSWLPQVGAALSAAHDAASLLGQRSALATAQVARADLLAAVGTALGGLLPPGGARVAGSWVSSASVVGSDDVTWLLELFPTARVVHLLRHPDAAVRSLTTQACGDGRYASPDSGYRAWTESVAALVQAERAHGSGRVLRLTVDELLAAPQAALSRCLSMLGLPPHGPCAAPVRAVPADPDADPAPAARTAAEEAGGGVTEERAAAVHAYRELVRADGVPAADAAGVGPLLAGLRTTTGRAGPDATAGHEGRAQNPYAQFVTLALPAGATAAVISKGDPVLVTVPGRHCWHLPRTADGRYAGFHPADSREALHHLRTAIRDGARYLVIPGASRWWLEHYRGLAEHLRDHARPVAHHEDIATVYALKAEEAPR